MHLIYYVYSTASAFLEYTIVASIQSINKYENKRSYGKIERFKRDIRKMFMC